VTAAELRVDLTYANGFVQYCVGINDFPPNFGGHGVTALP